MSCNSSLFLLPLAFISHQSASFCSRELTRSAGFCVLRVSFDLLSHRSGLYVVRSNGKPAKRRASLFLRCRILCVHSSLVAAHHGKFMSLCLYLVVVSTCLPGGVNVCVFVRLIFTSCHNPVTSPERRSSLSPPTRNSHNSLSTPSPSCRI